VGCLLSFAARDASLLHGTPSPSVCAHQRRSNQPNALTSCRGGRLARGRGRGVCGGAIRGWG
jgi:hypothetical protein